MTGLSPLIREADERAANARAYLEKLAAETLPGLEPDEEAVAEEATEVQERAAA